jgi:hypothetical protein
MGINSDLNQLKFQLDTAHILLNRRNNMPPLNKHHSQDIPLSIPAPGEITRSKKQLEIVKSYAKISHLKASFLKQFVAHGKILLEQDKHP